MNKFIEVKDALGADALIDPSAIQAVEQDLDNGVLILYFSNRFNMEISESYTDFKRKLNKALN